MHRGIWGHTWEMKGHDTGLALHWASSPGRTLGGECQTVQETQDRCRAQWGGSEVSLQAQRNWSAVEDGRSWGWKAFTKAGV